MLRPRSRDGGDDSGFAVVMALLITMIAFVIMAGVLAEAIHNVTLAGYGRRRVAAVSAAEAGLNWYANQLSTSNLAALTSPALGWTAPASNCDAATQNLQTTCWYQLNPSLNAAALPRVTVANRPELATFELRVLFTSQNPCQTAAGAAVQCGLANLSIRPTTWSAQGTVTQKGVLKLSESAQAPFPDTAYAIIRSTGVVGSAKRTLETYVRVRAIRASVQGGLAAVSLCMGSAAKVLVEGDLTVSNQAFGQSSDQSHPFYKECRTTWQTGNVVVSSGNELKIKAYGGSAGGLTVVGGGLSVDSNSPFAADGDVWTEKAIVLGSGTSGGVCPASDPRQCIAGDAMGQTVTVGSKAAVSGDVIECGSSPCQPGFTFPTLVWRPADWTGWTIREVSSTSGLLNLMDAVTSPTVFHISSTAPSSCDLTFSKSSATVSGHPGEVWLKTDVAVVSSCRFRFLAASADVIPDASASGTPSLMLISAMPDAGTDCTPYGTAQTIGLRDVEISQNPNVTTGFFIYTPCFLWIGNNQNSGNQATVKGQFAARYIIVDNYVTLTQVNIGNYVSTIPGQVSRFYQDVKFVREISSSIAAANLGP